MRQKLRKITDNEIKLVADELKDKIVIYADVYKYKDIQEILRTADGDQIYLDHLQSVDYPGSAGQLQNMIANIPGMILFQEKIAKQKNISIVNLSQVGDKEIARSDRITKRPRYHHAYGSSILYQKSREFSAVYYPYKDYEESTYTFVGNAPTLNDYEIGIEKSSFSAIGVVKMNFDYEHCLFTDKLTKSIKTDYTSPEQETLF